MAGTITISHSEAVAATAVIANTMLVPRPKILEKRFDLPSGFGYLGIMTIRKLGDVSGQRSFGKYGLRLGKRETVLFVAGSM